MNESMQSALMAQRPVTILIATPGGEGAGRLVDWLVAAAAGCDYPVQGTSLPANGRHGGATTRYVEIYPVATSQLGGRLPVMALGPTPGAVDVVAASELAEAGRMMQQGYLDPERTALVASTHRVYTVAEKMMPGDGRADSRKIRDALGTGASRAILFDMASAARSHAAMLDAVLFGALCGSGALPLARDACERAIRESGADAEASLRGFAAGYAAVSAAGGTVAPEAALRREAPPVERVRRQFPAETVAVLEAGVARLADYQDRDYAELYLDRLEPVLALDREAGGAANGYRLTRETGRQLARWMSFEDMIRIADLKTRQSRFDRLRVEAGTGAEEVVTVTDYLQFGAEELCALLPQGPAQRLRQWAKDNGKESFTLRMRVKSGSLGGFLLLRAVSGLRRWRRRTSRYQAEHRLMERWLGAIRRLGFAVQDVELALEIAECARLVRGYGEAHRNGVLQFERIFDSIVESGTESDPKKLAAAIARARRAALGFPDAVPARPPAGSDPGKPIFWMPRKTPEKVCAGST